jgi:hypothetical protein
MDKGEAPYGMDVGKVVLDQPSDMPGRWETWREQPCLVLACLGSAWARTLTMRGCLAYLGRQSLQGREEGVRPGRAPPRLLTIQWASRPQCRRPLHARAVATLPVAARCRRRLGAAASTPAAATQSPSVAIQIPRPARRRPAVVDAAELLYDAARTVGAAAVALCLGEPARGAGAVGAYLAEGDGRGAGSGRAMGAGGVVRSDCAVLADALKLEALAVAAAVWAAVAFDL